MTWTQEYVLRKEICDIGKRMYNREMVAANDGNISVRISDSEILCTPTGVSKGFMTPEQICKVDVEGRVVENGAGLEPSSEMKMHFRVYKERKDVQAVVHAHPPYATTFAISRKALDQPLAPEGIAFLGRVPVTDYATPTTEEVPESIAAHVKKKNAILLANHGALTCGKTLLEAYYKMESLEHYARLVYLSMGQGQAVELTEEEITRLYLAFHLSE